MNGYVQRDFDPSRDAAEIHWGLSILYNALRAASAGLFWGLMLVSLGEIPASELPRGMAMHVLAYAFTGIPVLLALKFLGRHFQILAAMGRVGSLFMVSSGDPLARLILALIPNDMRRIRQAPFFSPEPVLYVLDGTGVVVEPGDRLILELKGRP